MASIKALLDSYDPRLWFVAIALVVFLVVTAVKKLLPGVWATIPQKFQAIPATLIGALLAASASDSAKDIIVNVLMGAVGGVTAVGGFHFADRLQSGGRTPAPEPEN